MESKMSRRLCGVYASVETNKDFGFFLLAFGLILVRHLASAGFIQLIKSAA
jgi:hypothetical protein